MKVKGREVDFKLSRLEDAEKYELALRNMENKEKKLKEEMKKSGTLSGIIRGLVGMFREFFEDIGQPDVLKDCDDINEAKKAYLEFLEGVKAQRDDILKFNFEDIK